MTKGRLDLQHSQVPANSVYLTFNKLGGDSGNWNSIEAGSVIILRHGRLQQSFIVQFRQDEESFFTSLEMNPAIARWMKLLNQRRYAVSYNGTTRVMTLKASPYSRAPAVLRVGGASGQILIGYELQSALGIPERSRLAIACRLGSIRRRLIVRTPSNLFDRSFRLPASTMQSFGLLEGMPLGLHFDQKTLTLTMIPLRSSSSNPVVSRKNLSKAT
ncbi:hypothetical protein [Cohnella zeiphila]|uniref:Uncharacterized protein n=1 Tax=Cohnella zeiphila TaxID=2761120 RepID=A0A7X0SLU5_9BACL|nr:hypothetical protein [Cohnella zeiphila]MBB6732377.1 hypothetical protein [Cohnella zeiphila]